MPYLVLLAYEDRADARRLVSDLGGGLVVDFAALPVRLQAAFALRECVGVVVIEEFQVQNSVASRKSRDSSQISG